MIFSFLGTERAYLLGFRPKSSTNIYYVVRIKTRGITTIVTGDHKTFFTTHACVFYLLDSVSLIPFARTVVVPLELTQDPRLTIQTDQNIATGEDNLKGFPISSSFIDDSLDKLHILNSGQTQQLMSEVGTAINTNLTINPMSTDHSQTTVSNVGIPILIIISN